MVNGVSRVQIEWLCWLQTQDICVDSDGVRQTIQHALNFGEHQINGRPVDGFMIKDGIEHYFEFYGCYNHPGCCKPDSIIKNADERRRIDLEKLRDMNSRGDSMLK